MKFAIQETHFIDLHIFQKKSSDLVMYVFLVTLLKKLMQNDCLLVCYIISLQFHKNQRFIGFRL